MPGIEDKIKMIYSIYRNSRIGLNMHCPDEETIVCFIQGKLLKNELELVKKHLVCCSRCADAVSLLLNEIKEDREVPEELINSARKLLHQAYISRVFDIVLKLKEEFLQIVNTTADVILGNEIIPLPVLRSRKLSDLFKEIRLIRELNSIKITVLIQKDYKNRVRINLELLNRETLKPIDNLRLTLTKADCEIESYEVLSGSAVFSNIVAGQYIVYIYYEQNPIGVINIEIQ